MAQTYPVQPAHPTQQQLAVNCKLCIKQSVTNTPTYITPIVSTDYQYGPTTKPSICPVHPTHTLQQPYYRTPDYADTMCLNHATLSRHLAIQLINTQHERNLRNPPQPWQTPTDAYDLLYTLFPDGRKGAFYPMYQAFCPITCTCNHVEGCGATFTVLRAISGDIQTIIPTIKLYCIYCGQLTTTTTQPSTDETALLSLSMHYNLPPPVCNLLYTNWHNKGHYTYPTFRAYMQSELIQTLLSNMSTPHSTPTQPQEVTA